MTLLTEDSFPAAVRWRTNLGAGLAVLLAALGTSIANVALPGIVSAFAAPFAAAQWVVLAYLVAVTVMAVIAGRTGDRLGHGRALVLGLWLFALGAATAALAPMVWVLIAARAVQGTGAALMMVLPLALLRASTPPGRLGRSMGLMGSLSAIGTALGPALGGGLIAAGGWRAPFLLMAALALATLATLGPMPRHGGAGAATPPLLPLVALRRPGLRPGLIANGLMASVMMATLVAGPFFLTQGLGLFDWQVGLVMAAGPATSALTGLPAGRLVDRIGSLPAARAGLILCGAGALAMALLPMRIGLSGYLLALVLMPPGYQLFQAALTTRIMARAEEDQRGLMSGFLSLSRNLGLITGASLMAAVFGRFADAGGALAAGQGLSATFLLAVGLLALAFALMRAG